MIRYELCASRSSSAVQERGGASIRLAGSNDASRDGAISASLPNRASSPAGRCRSIPSPIPTEVSTVSASSHRGEGSIVLPQADDSPLDGTNIRRQRERYRRCSGRVEGPTLVLSQSLIGFDRRKNSTTRS